MTGAGRPSGRAIDVDDPVELARFRNDRGAWLDGALYRPQAAPIAGLLLVHGKGGNFYSGPSRALAPLLRREGVLCLAMNMACHDLAYSRTESDEEEASIAPAQANGGMWEDLSAGHSDLAAGVETLAALGGSPVVVLGHSSGGFYAVDYAIRRGEPDGVVLLSPLTANRTAFRRWFESRDDERALLAAARQLVDSGTGERLLPLDSWYYAISARSLVERAAEDPGYFTSGLEAMRCPLLMAWGTAEDRRQLWAETFARAGGEPKRCFEMEGAGHEYDGWYVDLAGQVLNFVVECIGR